MGRTVARGWRVVATCLAFAVFHLGGLLVSLPLIALCQLVPASRAARERRVQRVIQVSFRCFAAGLVAMGLLTCSRRRIERLRDARGCLVIANHPTLLDVVLLIGSMPRVDCVIKRAVWDNFFLRATVRSAGYIANHDGKQVLDACVERIASGRAILLFPEGTRSPPGGILPFQRMAARIALHSGCAIVPVRITCEPPMLLKGRRWNDVPERRSRYTLEVLDTIEPPAGGARADVSPREVRELSRRLESLYADALSRARA